MQTQNNQHTHHSTPGYIHSTMLPKLKCPNKMENPQNQTKKRRQKAANHKPPKTKQEPEAVEQEQKLLNTLNRAGTGSPENSCATWMIL